MQAQTFLASFFFASFSRSSSCFFFSSIFIFFLFSSMNDFPRSFSHAWYDAWFSTTLSCFSCRPEWSYITIEKLIWEKGKANRLTACMIEKKAALVLLKMFINRTEWLVFVSRKNSQSVLDYLYLSFNISTTK